MAESAIPATKNPHTVSQVVLRRFSKGRRWLTRYDVDTGAVGPTTTREFGATDQIPLDRAPKFEARWQQVEKRLNDAIDAVCRGKMITDPKTLDVLRDLVAMHYARTIDILAGDRATWQQAVEGSIASIAAHPDTAGSFRRRHGGIEPVGHQALELEARVDDRGGNRGCRQLGLRRNVDARAVRGDASPCGQRKRRDRTRV